MSVLNHKVEFNSPTEDIFPWVTPETEPNRRDLPTKRKCASDSGYMSSSVSPASEIKSALRSCTFMTPDVASYEPNDRDPHYTPAVRLRTEYVKKRLLQDGTPSTPTTPEVDSFSDLMDTSLYMEPMDVSTIRSDPQLDMIAEENLDAREISKKITLDLSMNSFHSEPITPLKCTTPCDRLFQTPASLKVKFSSPKRKKFFLKKKLSRPGAMIGSEHIDFFAHLGVRANFSMIAHKIIDLLSDQDISNMTMVSKTWKNVCLSYPKAKDRWSNYVMDRKFRKENLPHCGSEGKKFNSTSELRMNWNHSTPFRLKQPISPPVSPSKFRFHLFQKEARRLKEDEKLAECPRCSMPSTVSPADRLGRCTRAGCGLEFCACCRSPFHGRRPCSTSTPASPQRPPAPRPRVIGSKESKRYLRRL